MPEMHKARHGYHHNPPWNFLPAVRAARFSCVTFFEFARHGVEMWISIFLVISILVLGTLAMYWQTMEA